MPRVQLTCRVSYCCCYSLLPFLWALPPFSLMELHSLALKTWPKYNAGVFYEPESSTKCYKSNTKHLNKLSYFHHRIAGEISPHYLRSRGEIWLRLFFHDSLGVFLFFFFFQGSFLGLTSIILFETLALFNFVRSSLKAGNRTSPAIKIGLFEKVAALNQP